ncbi:nucleotidyltransferase domain-containing protein [Nonomuraea gerenzanensis]|uniref:ORFX n=1 Tax=Nonomuraea gerenzanensis TaxID=93944 RepID=A0A1M4EED2_9ACTN|nr:nucleotidyltransferase domain-containing protein [Nonomuraea gerenzanensis]UBU08962.1 nucleotidyltransferase domain-containing protein [Nonomuraea gerenzanensis]SBO97341.1 ORFX [Nonomuraea gerenzanensis]
MRNPDLHAIADRLAAVPGVVAVALGGSRARGTHRPDSDIDLGLYYRKDLAVNELRTLARQVTGQDTDVTAPGGWGPWVDGGGWLTIDGWRVDWIYRDLDRVHRIWRDCQAGRYEIGVQAGHPLGFYSHAYAGEVALCQVLADPAGELAALREETTHYPPALREALIAGLWECDFALMTARYGAAGQDPVYAAGALFRAVGVACQALHAADGAWLINEKGMVASAGRLPSAPEGFAERAQALLAGVGGTPEEITRTIDAAAGLIADVRAACAA